MPEWLALFLVAVVSVSGALVASRYGRVAHLEKRLSHLEVQNRRLWLHFRAQIDHAYRSGIIPLPIPDDLFGEEEK